MNADCELTVRWRSHWPMIIAVAEESLPAPPELYQWVIKVLVGL